MLEKHGNMKILPNIQRLGKLTFDSNQVKKSKTNPNVLIAKASDGKDYGVVRKSDGSYDYAGSSRNATLGERLNIASASPNIFGRALGTSSTLMSEPQRMMTRVLSGNKYNTPSEVVANSKLPDGRLKNTLGFAADIVADPFNLVGAGVGTKALSSLRKVANKIPINQIVSLPKFSMPRSLKGFSVEDLRNLTQQSGITNQQAIRVMDFKNRKAENILANRFRENDAYSARLRQENINTETPVSRMQQSIETRLRQNEQYAEELRRRNDLTYSESQNRRNTFKSIIDTKNQRDENLLESYRREVAEMTERRNPLQVQSPNLSDVTNVYSRSGITREGVLNKVDDKTKELIKNLPDEDFKKIVLKPNNEIDFIASDLNVGRNTSGIEQMSRENYIKTFNDNLPKLNEIITRKNTSGVPYTATGIDEGGRINFNSSRGQGYFNTVIVPGKFKGEVQDIADSDYYKKLPGLNMGNTMSGVFGDGAGIPGTKTYESINDYLKSLDLGRVKPGFNSQTETRKDVLGRVIRTGSKDVWENFVKSGKAVGYYNNPNTVYGSMKTVLPPAAIAAGAAASTINSKNNKFKYGGKLLPLLNKF
jgi:hypothetical protein